MTTTTNKAITIAIGLGRSGIAAAKYLNAKGQNVLIFEESKKESFQQLSRELTKEGIKVKLGMPMQFSSFKPWLNQLQSVVTSPGIPWDHPTLNQLRNQGISIEAEISLAWENLKNIPWVGVTGTNGKTTVTHMLNHVLKKCLISSNIGGNVGKAACELALEFKIYPETIPKWLIVELSSYQIESAPNISPRIGIWTTLTPDHLDRHGSIENYFEIKRSLIANSSIRIYNGNDKYLESHRPILPKGIWINTNTFHSNNTKYDYWISKNGKLTEKGKELFDTSILNLPGNHNLQNLLLVTAAARKIGLSPHNIEAAISDFKGIEHRLEKIGAIKNIEVFNDSKSTNFDSVEIALKAINKKTILIAGGQLKKGNSKNWIKEIHLNTCAIILFGESRYDLKKIIEISSFKGKIFTFQTLDKAVTKSVNLGIELKAKSILFSPGCASFDQYNNFEERGIHFKSLIKEYST